MALPFGYGPLRQILDSLPPILRSSVINYLDRVDEHTQTIFERARVPLNAESRQRFIFACAIRKVWVIVDSQYWTLTGAVSLLRRYDVSEAAIGSARYGPTSRDYQSIVQIRGDLASQLVEVGLLDVAYAGSLADLAVEITQWQ
jgi:hypothetical protein